MEHLEKDIIDFIEKSRCIYIKLSKKENIEKVYNILFNNDMIDINCGDGELLHYYGFYNKIIVGNYDETIRYYREAVKYGNKHAMYNLACMYRDGEYIEANQEEAMKLFKMSAEQKNEHAIYYLVSIYSSLVMHLDKMRKDEYFTKKIDEIVRLCKIGALHLNI